ncbi:hypothetical protein P167DRAFT_536913 [Morchella conica CCBAS932]|uniref:Uncharacterized protein n=1 Tax=Morchella conica CCBAS932 TaxID=1392247 RepID=A0A3N4KPF3_9PEZI|nr:hypothetical protein P167DRAFT_536913 [Morchella conica CCBAS932]
MCRVWGSSWVTSVSHDSILLTIVLLPSQSAAAGTAGASYLWFKNCWGLDFWER